MSNRPSGPAAGQIVQPAAGRVGRVGNIRSMLKVMKPLGGSNGDAALRKRQLLADMCRLIGDQLQEETPKRVDLDNDEGLSPRMEQTLRWLLGGDSEKQVAAKLKLSPHTVHVYVKAIYRRYGVSSRGELLARWVKK